MNKNYKNVGQAQDWRMTMLHYQYHCACCNKVVNSADKECPECGSHNIRSPFGFWIFCILTCLAVAILFKSVQVYLQQHDTDTPAQMNIFEILQHDEKTNK